MNLTLFYDGQCPLCAREMAQLKRRRCRNLELVDLYSEAFKPYSTRINFDEANIVIHALRSDGVVLRGLDALHSAWSLAGAPWLYGITRLPGLRSLCDIIYRGFARHRMMISRWFGRDCGCGKKD